MIIRPLTAKRHQGYDIPTVAKNSGQNWRSEFIEIHGRIFSGFFYAQNIPRVMTDCIEEPSGSPFSFMSGTPILYSLSPYQLALLVTVSKFIKETFTMSKQHRAGNLSSESHHLKICPVCRAYAQEIVLLGLQLINRDKHIQALTHQIKQHSAKQGGAS